MRAPAIPGPLLTSLPVVGAIAAIGFAQKIIMDENIESYAVKNLAQKSATSDPFSLERYAQFARYLPGKTKEVLDIGFAEGTGEPS